MEIGRDEKVVQGSIGVINSLETARVYLPGSSGHRSESFA